MANVQIMRNASLANAAILLTISLVLVQLASWALTEWLGLPAVNVGPGFMLIIVMASVILPFVIMDAAPKRSAGEVFMVLMVIALDVILLVYIAPVLLPNMFQPLSVNAIPATKLAIMSVIG